MVKEFFIPFFVVMFVQNAYLQIAPLLILFAITIYVLLIKKPYKSKGFNLFMAFVEICYFIIFTGLLIVKIQENSMSQKTKYTIYGYGTIGSAVKNFKEKCVKKRKIAPLDDGPGSEFNDFVTFKHAKNPNSQINEDSKDAMNDSVV
jgi:hypothetical protein